MNPFEPVNPWTLTPVQLFERGRMFLELWKLGVRDEPPPPGTFRCFLCCWMQEFDANGEEKAEARFRERFPGQQLEKDLAACPSCDFLIALIAGIDPG